MRPPMRCLNAVLVLATATAAQSNTVAPLGDAAFERLHAELCPKKKGKWEQIPWTVDLLAARHRAIKAKKPLFMWSMNGHPLGCT